MKDLAFIVVTVAILVGGLGMGRLTHLSTQNAVLESRLEDLERENESLKNMLLGSFGGK